MNNQPLISVIIPTYGHPDYLVKSIESVISQTISDWELIIVDDNNPETEARAITSQLVHKYMSEDGRIKYIQHDCNKNGAVARNTGFASATGTYIALLDSDDEYLPSRLEKCLSVMARAGGNIAGVYTGCEFRKRGKVYFKSIDVSEGNYLVETLACTFGFFTGSNTFVRKSVVDELQGFDPNFLRHQDYDFLVRLFLKYNITAIPEILVIKNNEGYNVPALEKIISIKKQYLDKYKNIIEDLPVQEQKYIWQRQYVAIAEHAMRCGDTSQANAYYKKASVLLPLTRTDWTRRLLLPIKRLFF